MDWFLYNEKHRHERIRPPAMELLFSKVAGCWQRLLRCLMNVKFEDLSMFSKYMISRYTQQTFTCFKSTIATFKKRVRYVQS